MVASELLASEVLTPALLTSPASLLAAASSCSAALYRCSPTGTAALQCPCSRNNRAVGHLGLALYPGRTLLPDLVAKQMRYTRALLLHTGCRVRPDCKARQMLFWP